MNKAGTSREQADAAVAGAEIHEFPSARGCTCVGSAAQYAIALTVGQVARKLGGTDSEIDKLSQAVVDALAEGALDTDDIKR